MNKKILVYNNRVDLDTLIKKIKEAVVLEKDDILKIKKIFKLLNEVDRLIVDDSFFGELLAILFKIINSKKSFDIWIDEFKEYPFYQKELHNITMKLSKNIFTRSKQIRFYINQIYKKPVFVIYPWVKEVNYKKREPKYNIFLKLNREIKLPNNWNRVDNINDADISLLEFEKKTLKISMPKIIFKSISLRIPTVIINENSKLINKLFKSIPTVYTSKNINFYDLEYLMFKNYSFKVPKRYRFNYNLANFKKLILK